MASLNGKKYMDVVTYTGNGSAQIIDGLSFSPDLVWIKSRTSQTWHQLNDTVRGAGNRLYSNETSQQDTSPASDNLTGFTSQGFTLGADSNASGVNVSGEEYVAWCWDAGSETVTNTDGEITSQVRANPAAGFSIVNWTTPSWNGAPQSVGHGLGKSPAMIIVKSISDAASWYCYHKDIVTNPSVDAKDYYLMLNQNNGRGQLDDSWGTTAPDSLVFGDRQLAGSSGSNSLAYCWSEVPGYSKFGIYTGNSSSNFIYTGFKPAFILTKQVDDSSDWQMWDSARMPINPNTNTLDPSNATPETGDFGYSVDFLSNGFKFNDGGSSSNGSGREYVYMVFAERSLAIDPPESDLTFASSKDLDQFFVGQEVTQGGKTGTITAKSSGTNTISVNTVGFQQGASVTSEVFGSGIVQSVDIPNNKMVLKDVEGNFSPQRGKFILGSVRRLPKYQSETSELIAVTEPDLDYKIEQSLLFDGSEYLTRTQSGSDDPRKWTYSVWVKRTNPIATEGILEAEYQSGGGGVPSDVLELWFNTYKLAMTDYASYFINSDELFIDISKWYHIVVAVDTTLSSAVDRVKLYVDGEAQDTNGAEIPQNIDCAINGLAGSSLNMGNWRGGTYSSSYMADAQFVDGHQLDCNAFGEFNPFGQWIAKDYLNSKQLGTITATTGDTQITVDGSTSDVTPGSFINQDGGYTPETSAITNISTASYTALTTWSPRRTVGNNQVDQNGDLWYINDLNYPPYYVEYSSANVGTSAIQFVTSYADYDSLTLSGDFEGSPITITPQGAPDVGAGATLVPTKVSGTITMTFTGFGIQVNWPTGTSLLPGGGQASYASLAPLTGNSTLTLTDSTDLENFRVGDAVQEEGSPTTALVYAQSNDEAIGSYFNYFVTDPELKTQGWTILDSLDETLIGTTFTYSYFISNDGISWSKLGNYNSTEVVGNPNFNYASFTIYGQPGVGEAKISLTGLQYAGTVGSLPSDNPFISEVSITAIDESTPSITTDGGTWTVSETVTGPTLSAGNGTVGSVSGNDINYTLNSGRFITGKSVSTTDKTYGSNGFHLPFDPAAVGSNYSSDCTWTFNSAGQGPDMAFNGAVDATNAWYTATSTTQSFTPPGGITAVSLEIWIAGTGTNFTSFKVNGTEALSSLTGVSDAWVDLSSYLTGGQFNSWVAVRSSNGSAGISGIRIDGSILVDHNIGVDDSGNGNHFADSGFAVGNTSQVWSNFLFLGTQSFQSDNPTNTDWSYDPVEDAFDGDVSNPAYTPLERQYVYFCRPFSGVNKLEVWVNNSSYCDQIGLDTSSTVLANPVQGSGWYELPVVNNTFDRIWFHTTNGGSSTGVWAIRINGQILIDPEFSSSVVDSPTDYGTGTGLGAEVRGNYAVLNPFDNNGNNDSATLSNGNLTAKSNTTSANFNFASIYLQDEGKYYFEYTVDTIDNSGIGFNTVLFKDVEDRSECGISGVYSSAGNPSTPWGYYTYDNPAGEFRTDYSGPTPQWTPGDVFMLAIDVSTRKVYVGMNGSWIDSDPTTGDNAMYVPGNSDIGILFGYRDGEDGNASNGGSSNFGQKPWTYQAPAGFLALNTKNLP